MRKISFLVLYTEAVVLDISTYTERLEGFLRSKKSVEMGYKAAIKKSECADYGGARHCWIMGTVVR